MNGKENKNMFQYILARKIKESRLKRHLTLEDVAKNTGFTKGLISRIENNKVSPPIATLFKISRAVGVSLEYLFRTETPTGYPRVSKRNKRETVVRSKGEKEILYEPLRIGRADSDTEAFIVTVTCMGSDKGDLDEHSGEEIILVLEGKMQYIWGNQVFSLEEGDSIHFNANVPHGEKLPKGGKVKYLLVMSE